MLHFKWQKLFHTNYHKIGQTFEYKCHCGGKICVKQNYFGLEFFIFLLTIIINFWKIFIGYTTWLTFSLKKYDFFIGTNIWKKALILIICHSTVFIIVMENEKNLNILIIRWWKNE